MEIKFYPQIFEKHSNIKFNENPSSESRVVPCGQTDGRKDMTKLIVAFRNIATHAEKWKRNIVKAVVDQFRVLAGKIEENHYDVTKGSYSSYRLGDTQRRG
jgi:hypothetical protein